MILKNHTKNLVRLSAIGLIVLFVFVCSQAQTKKKKKPSWNWKEHQTEVIDYAKNYQVSDIEANLPQMSFAAWFQKVVGAKNRVKWKLADCNQPNPCVKSAARITKEIYLSVDIEYGKFDQGFSGSKPIVRHIFISDEAGNGFSSAKDLGSLPELVKSIKKILAFFDPNHGEFEISGKKPAGFMDFSSIWFQTLEYGEKFWRHGSRRQAF